MGAVLLTTLPAVKQWLEIDTANVDADVLLLRLIRGASAFLLNQLNRQNLALTNYTEMYDGYGNVFMVVRQNPVYEITNLSFAGTPISAATGNGFDNPFTGGYVLEPEYSASPGSTAQRINLYGYRFPRGRGLVRVQYRAGYVRVNEPYTIPDESPWSGGKITTDYMWLGDEGVVYALTGVAMVKVADNPEEGQYSVDADGVYSFAEEDKNLDILITYSFVPADIQEAATLLVGERYRYMDRIGYVSKSLGGQETVTFSQSAMSQYTRDSLIPYKNVVPI